MKKLLLTWVIVFLAIGLGWAQTENTLVQTFTPEEDCHFAVFALNGTTKIQTWEEQTIKVVYTITGENINEEANLHQIEMQFHEEERVMIFENTLMNIELTGELLEIQIFIPNGIKYQVVPTNIQQLL